MLALLVLVGCLVFDETPAFEYEEYNDDTYSYYDVNEEVESDLLPCTELARVRRYPDRILDPQNFNEIEGVLREIMPGRNIDDWSSDTSSTNSETNTNKLITSVGDDNDNFITRTDHDIMTPRTRNEYVFTPNIINNNSIQSTNGEFDSLTWMTTSEHDNNQNLYGSLTSKVHRTSHTPQPINAIIDGIDSQEKQELFAYIDSMTGDGYLVNKKGQKPTRIPLVTPDTNENVSIESEEWWKLGRNFPNTSTSLDSQTTTESTSSQTEVTSTTQKTTTTKPIQFDIERFLEIISNLTYDYYTNLTEQVNETFIRMSVPTCGTPTTTTELTTTHESGIIDYSHFGENVIGKCFVCGLEDVGIPYNAHCADAFAGDFLPLVPQDPRAKGQIARFRKYCRYKEVNNFLVNATMPRSIFGRWTGGCSVRWTDLSGIYTQRSCRNRRQAATGRHFASKRMAKLEMTLSNMDNGCIISPVATLLPLSRGISLFARFHACVCTGNWCNRAVRLDSDSDKWMTFFVASLTVLRLLSS